MTNTPNSEYVIWGIAPGTMHEDLLVSEYAGLRDRAHAEATVKTLEEKHGCSALRIEKLRPLCDAAEVSKLFASAAA